MLLTLVPIIEANKLFFFLKVFILNLMGVLFPIGESSLKFILSSSPFFDDD